VTRSQIVKRSLAGVLAAILFAYVMDYAYLRIRMIHPKPADPFESMVRNRLLAIPQKNGMLDYELDQVHPTDTLTCVHSLFPHYGDPPCWYLKPRINDPIPVGTVFVR
jgi:hypothetical protein